MVYLVVNGQGFFFRFRGYQLEIGYLVTVVIYFMHREVVFPCCTRLRRQLVC